MGRTICILKGVVRLKEYVVTRCCIGFRLAIRDGFLGRPLSRERGTASIVAVRTASDILTGKLGKALAARWAALPARVRSGDMLASGSRLICSQQFPRELVGAILKLLEWTNGRRFATRLISIMPNVRAAGTEAGFDLLRRTSIIGHVADANWRRR